MYADDMYMVLPPVRRDGTRETNMIEVYSVEGLKRFMSDFPDHPMFTDSVMREIARWVATGTHYAGPIQIGYGFAYCPGLEDEPAQESGFSIDDFRDGPIADDI